jgi:hypothetical protein
MSITLHLCVACHVRYGTALFGSDRSKRRHRADIVNVSSLTKSGCTGLLNAISFNLMLSSCGWLLHNNSEESLFVKTP